MTKPKPLSSGWRLSLDSLATWKRHIKMLTLVTAVVAVPANLIQLLVASTDTTVSAYVSLASVVMNLALIWTIIKLGDGDKAVTLRGAYYDGTASIVRFLLVSFILVAELIPLTLGLFLYNVGVIGAAPGTTNFEKGVVALIVVLMALPSLFWFNRSVLALVAAPEGALRPMAAVRKSWASVKGHSWQVLRRLLFLIVAGALLIAIPAAVLVVLYDRTTNRGFLALLQVFASLFILPFIDIYLYKLYRELA